MLKKIKIIITILFYLADDRLNQLSTNVIKSSFDFPLNDNTVISPIKKEYGIVKRSSKKRRRKSGKSKWYIDWSFDQDPFFRAEFRSINDRSKNPITKPENAKGQGVINAQSITANKIDTVSFDADSLVADTIFAERIHSDSVIVTA